MSYHALDCKDLHREMLWVFYEYVGDNLAMRPEYLQYCCRECGNLDCLEALKHGVSKSFRGPKAKRDAADSSDSQLIVSSKCLDVFYRVAKGYFHVFDIPNDDRYKIIFPKRMLQPPKRLPKINMGDPYEQGVPFRNYGGICLKCGRYKNLSIRDEFYFVPDDIQLAGMEICSSHKRPLISWIANDEIMEALSQGLTGWWIEKNAFANDRKISKK